MKAGDIKDLMTAGLHDKERFMRDLGEWMEHPITVRLLASFATLRANALKTIATPISDDKQVFRHNENCMTANVLKHVLDEIDGLTGSTGGTT